jgi:hypothetical protein
MITKVFNLLKSAGRKRIRERGIMWKEHYHDRSTPLKKRMDKLVGPGSYYRFEGKDYTSGSDYFIVIGPSQEKYGRKSFFAGIKKLPPVYRRKKIYAPSGKYFPSIMSALSYANRMWGTPIPANQTNYTVSDIENINIPKKIKG